LKRAARVRRWLHSGAALCFAVCGLMTAAASSPPASIDRVMAAVPDAEHGKILYLKHCPACHAPHGWGDGPRAIPALAGQHEGYLIEQLTDFATAKRAGDSMHEIMRHADLNWPQAVRDLSAYLSRAPRSRASGSARMPIEILARPCTCRHVRPVMGSMERDRKGAPRRSEVSSIATFWRGYATSHPRIMKERSRR